MPLNVAAESEYFVVLCGSGPDDLRFENPRNFFLELASSISLRRV